MILCVGLISILRKWGNGESVRAGRFDRPTLIRLQHVAQRTHRLGSYLQAVNVLITKCNTARLYWVGVMTSGCLKRADTFFLLSRLPRRNPRMVDQLSEVVPVADMGTQPAYTVLDGGLTYYRPDRALWYFAVGEEHHRQGSPAVGRSEHQRLHATLLRRSAHVRDQSEREVRCAGGIGGKRNGENAGGGGMNERECRR